MKAHALWLLLLCLPAAAGAAERYPYRAHMTGEDLIRDMRADPGIGRNMIVRERAMGYIDGVMDAAAGRSWCPAGKVLPHEMNYILIDDMEGLSPDQLKGDASALMLRILAKGFPCKTSGSKP